MLGCCISISWVLEVVSAWWSAIHSPAPAFVSLGHFTNQRTIHYFPVRIQTPKPEGYGHVRHFGLRSSVEMWASWAPFGLCLLPLMSCLQNTKEQGVFYSLDHLQSTVVGWQCSYQNCSINKGHKGIKRAMLSRNQQCQPSIKSSRPAFLHVPFSLLFSFLQHRSRTQLLRALVALTEQLHTWDPLASSSEGWENRCTRPHIILPAISSVYSTMFQTHRWALAMYY